MGGSRTAVSAELSLGLVGPERTIVPLMASMYYNCSDPYEVRMAFHVGTDDPVEWVLARNLLTAALHASEGIGDVRAWPSAASCDPAAAGAPEAPGGVEGAEGAAAGTAAGSGILNIAMSSPFGQAQFEASAQAVEEFLQRTYLVVPAGQEPDYLDIDAELTQLFSEA